MEKRSLFFVMVFCCERIVFQNGVVPLCLTRDLTPAATGARNPCLAERSWGLYFKATPFSDVLMFFVSFAIAAFCCRASRCRNINMQSSKYFENSEDNEKSNVKVYLSLNKYRTLKTYGVEVGVAPSFLNIGNR